MILSIITINYNNACGLEKTISSIVKLLTPNIEYIVIDGASTDNSIDIIKNYSDKISYWVSEPDSGIYNAMNKGIKESKGEYILFINSGDIIHNSQFISSYISELKDADIIYCNLKIEGNNINSIKEYPDSLDIKYFLEDTLPHPASFIKRELFHKYGYYNENMKICSDWAFFFRLICFENCTYKYVSSDFSTFYIDGISSNLENREAVWKERRLYIKEELPLLYNLYIDWIQKKDELYKLKCSRSIRFMKKLSFLKWFNVKF